MKFVPAKTGAGVSEWPAAKQRHAAIAEMKPPVGKARRERQQPRHSLSAPLGVDQIFAEHHIAAAFTIHRFLLGCGAAQAGGKSLGGG